LVYDDGAGILVHGQRVELAGIDAGVVLALGAEVGHLDPREWHEHPDPGGLGPNPVLVVQGAGDLAPSAAAALEVVSGYPNLICHITT
jgi:hypothetical protein